MAKLKTTNQSAPGPMLGYIFQIERALLWLSQTGQDGTVAIETDDDLVIELKKNLTIEKLYEQDKSSALSERNPFSNKSLDLWKTLKIWAVNILEGTIDLDESSLLMVTNKIVSNCFIKQLMGLKLNRADFDMKLTKLLQAGLDSKTDEIKEYAEIVQMLQLIDADLFRKMFEQMDVMDIQYSHDRNEIKKLIKSNLHVSDDLPLNLIYSDLIGWLTNLIVARWLSGEQAIINGKELNTYYSNQIIRYASKPFLEKAKEVVPVKDSERAVHKRDNFVKQLGWIKLEEKHVLKAIDDFIRARWERSQFAIEGNIPSKKDFDTMDDNLHERWENLKTPIERQCVTEEDKINRGHDLYWLVMEHKARLANYDTEEYYTTKGAYHLMANEFRLGWHFDWEALKDSI